MTTAAAAPLIGVINAGSSSLKFSFYESERCPLSGQAEGLGARPSVSASGPDGAAVALSATLSTWRQMGVSWRSLASIPARDGSRAIY
jgi:hypothetical protein